MTSTSKDQRMPARRERPPKTHPTASSSPHATTPGNVIFLPTYGLPKIENPVFRGVKKGCSSLGNARRKKNHEAAAIRSPGPQIPAPLPCNIRRAGPAELLSEFLTLYQTANDNGAENMLEMVEFAVIWEKKCRAKGNL